MLTELLLLAALQDPQRDRIQNDLRDILQRHTDLSTVNPELQRWKREWRAGSKQQPNTVPKRQPIHEAPPPSTSRTATPQGPPSEGASKGLTLFFVVLGAVLLAAACVAAYRAWLASRMDKTPSSPPGETRLTKPGTVDALTRDPEQWMDEARKLAARGDFPAAFRALYLALLVRLHRARCIEYDRTRTNREYVRRYRGADAPRDRFLNLTESFDLACYGGRPVTRESYLRGESDVRALLQLVDDGSK